MSKRDIRLLKNLERKLKSLDKRKLEDMRFRVYKKSLEDEFFEIFYKKNAGFVRSDCISYKNINYLELLKELKKNNYSIRGFVREFTEYIR